MSINVIGLYSAYGVPIFLRLRRGADFTAGPWHLGRYSQPVAAVAVAWICFSSVLFLLPQTSPVTAANFNYAPVALGAVLLVAGVWWLVTARTSYKPVMYGDPATMAEAQEAMA